jgi:hypothetical protein
MKTWIHIHFNNLEQIKKKKKKNRQSTIFG